MSSRRRLSLWVGALGLAVIHSNVSAQDTTAVQLKPVLERVRIAPGLLAAERVEAPADPRARQVCELLRRQVQALRERNNRLTDRQCGTLEALRARTAGDVHARVRFDSGLRQLRGRFNHAQRALASNNDRDVTAALAFLEQYRELVRLDDPRNELVLARKDWDPLGTLLRFEQVYKGVPIEPADLVVHVTPDGTVGLVGGAFVPTPRNAVVEPLLDAGAAVDRARAAVGGGASTAEPRLVLHARETSPPRLAWVVRLRRTLISEIEVVVGALDGRLLGQRELVMQENVAGSGVDLFGQVRPLNVWRDGSTYYMVDTSKPMFDPTSAPPNDPRGGIMIIDALNGRNLFHVTSGSPNAWSVPDAVSASWGFGQVYDYFLQVHGRNSYDGLGSTIFGVVRFEVNHANASWNPDLRVMVFGDADRYAGSLDVVAHEMTHAVVSFSANLEYLGQSGALNESFSDIFGELVEARALGANDWIIGSGLQQPLRNMANPRALNSPFGPYPARMSEYYNLPFSDAGDHGGVHINSSIINHCFYLLAEGMNGAIGKDDAGRIFYRALTQHLTKASQFKDARLACVASAEELFGAASAQALAVAAAFDAVEIGDAAPSEDPFEFPEVASADSTLFVFLDAGTGDLFLGRRDTNEGDGDSGIVVDASTPVAAARISVSGNGDFGVCVTEDQDLGLIDTYGASTGGAPVILPLGIPGSVYSVAMDAAGERFAFVFLDAVTGEPTNQISVVDIATSTDETFTLETAVVDGGGTSTAVKFADVMAFTADGQFLFYDALNEVSIDGGATEQLWSIYALFLPTGLTLSVVPPIPGLQIGNPAFARTTDNFLAFDVFEESTLQNFILAGNLSTGDLEIVAVVANAFGVPSYTGDDTAIVYQSPDGTTTGASLLRQELQGRLMPVGQPTGWLADATLGIIYRRGVFEVPNAPPDATIDTPVANLTINEGEAVSFSASGSDPNAHVPLTYLWDFGGSIPLSSTEDPGLVTFPAAGVYTVRLTVFDSEALADPTPATRRITVLAPPPPPPPPGGGGGGGGGGAMDPFLLALLAAAVLLGRSKVMA